MGAPTRQDQSPVAQLLSTIVADVWLMNPETESNFGPRQRRQPATNSWEINAAIAGTRKLALNAAGCGYGTHRVGLSNATPTTAAS
jgi:hypothetical protein